MGANDWPVGRAWAWAVVMLFAAQAYAFPTEYVYKAGVACQDHPMRAMGAHGSPVPDPDTTFSFTDPGVQGAPAKVFCPGGSYGVAAKFPVRRLALLTASSGAVSADKRCPSRQYSGGKQSDGFSTTWSVPCDAAGESVVFKVTSAAGSKDNYHESGVTVGVGYTDGPCEAISKKAGCKPAPAPKAPLKPKPAAPKAAAPKATAKALPLLAKPGLKEAAEGAAKKFAPVKIAVKGGAPTAVPIAVIGGPAAGAVAKKGLADSNADLLLDTKAGDKLLLAPLVAGSGTRSTMLVLHGALMMGAFLLLLPLGALLARHRWMLGSDPRTGKVLSSWLWLHVGVQVLAILLGLAGVALAVVGCGFKRVPSAPLYEPHKWLGVAVLAAALLQLAAAPLGPARGAPRRRGWDVMHRAWGAVVAAAGAANAFLGVFLMHDYRKHSLVTWLAPAAACVGALLLAAMVLEALRAQMQRTHRWDPRSDEMRSVFDGWRRSGKRGSADGGGKEGGGKEGREGGGGKGGGGKGRRVSGSAASTSNDCGTAAKGRV